MSYSLVEARTEESSKILQMLSLSEMNRLHASTLEEYHHMFSLMEGERGETNLVEFN